MYYREEMGTTDQGKGRMQGCGAKPSLCPVILPPHPEPSRSPRTPGTVSWIGRRLTGCLQDYEKNALFYSLSK